jgi:hypothetical protein
MQKQFMGVAALGAALAIGDASHAQAVQWRVEDGGNGHWYEISSTASQATVADAASRLKGAFLAIVTSSAENLFLFQLAQRSPGFHSAWIGGFQDFSDSAYSEPAGAWKWLDGQPIGDFAAWDTTYSEPNNANGAQEDWIELTNLGTWNDTAQSLSRVAILEWSADCNADGIVDYGQCRDGSLPDYNSNNIPDCCEQGVPCSVGMYAVESRGSEGGNGHWYEVVPVRRYWADADAFARTRGGDLASLTSAAEDQLARRISSRVDWPWVGGFLDCTGVSGCCSGCAWRWTTGEPFSFTNWRPSEPNQAGVTERIAVTQGGWVDLGGTGFQMPSIIEWSADCDSDGIVDYGQILRGERPDANANGVPDGCECIADLNNDGVVQGADLGLMLAAWGSAPTGTTADVNRDGAVDGNDLGLMLAGWGACGG